MGVISALKVHYLVNNQLSARIGAKLLLPALILPWLVGFVLAGRVQQKGLLGSFRGLYCFATSWEDAWTGGLVIWLLVLSSVLTMGCYLYTFCILKRTRGARSAKGRSHLPILKRGGLLVLALISCWFLWALAGVLNFLHRPPPVSLEVVGAALITIQPILDFYLIFKVPAFRRFVAVKLERLVAGTDTNNMARKVVETARSDLNTSGSGSVSGEDIDLHRFPVSDGV
jgi:hypothetical protein